MQHLSTDQSSLDNQRNFGEWNRQRCTLSDGEWIELEFIRKKHWRGTYRPHDQTGTGGSIDLTDALVDCSCTIVSPHGLGPGEYGVIQLNGTGVEIIRTLGDTISLIDLSGKVVQTVTWQPTSQQVAR